MKNVILFISFVLAACFLRDVESKRMDFKEIKEVLLPVREICIQRVGADPKLIDEANKGNFTPDRRLKCYFKCMMIMTKSMTKDDKILESTFVKVAEVMMVEQYVKPVLKAFLDCLPVARQPLEGCDLAFELVKCYYHNNPELNFFP